MVYEVDLIFESVAKMLRYDHSNTVDHLVTDTYACEKKTFLLRTVLYSSLGLKEVKIHVSCISVI